ncbi:hypothetical protein DBR27_17755 [Flavobacterium sp. HMWF030]|nr:hypothetical protein DBR27_17755 [Flavobacterium sp. HMWF030]
MSMQVFINEKSLEGQFNSDNIENGIKTFIATLATLEKVKSQLTTYKSNIFFNEQAISGIHLNASLSNNGDLLRGFLNNLKSAETWEKSQVHDSETIYSWNKNFLTGTSVAEIAERKILDDELNCVLINFTNSTYSQNLQITVEKDQVGTVDIELSHSEATMISWLRTKSLIANHDAYDETSRIAPIDDQTVLGGAEFEITTYKNKGRRAYRLIGTRQLWAVDASEGHLFGKPHIEIFSEIDGLHIGTSIYNEINLDTSKKVNLRRININRHYPID